MKIPFWILSSIIVFAPLAATAGCCDDDCYCPITWEVYGSYLLLQPNGSDLTYGVEAIGLNSNVATPIASPDWNALEIRPDYHSGYEFGIGGFFCNNLNATLDWEHLNARDTRTFQTSSAAGYMVGPVFDIGPNSASYKIAQGTLTSKFDQVNLDFGREFCFCNLHANFFGGIAATRIQQNLKASFSNLDGTIIRGVESPSHFRGIGPQVGLDYSYCLTDHFFLKGTSVASLFVGNIKNKTTFLSYTPELTGIGIPQPNTQSVSVPNRTQLVPGFEQKLGFGYQAAFNCWSLSIDVGYQCQIYVDAVQTFDMTAPQVLPSGTTFTPQVGVFAVGFERTLSNYILSGPYATLTIQF